jgi:hypothetical protein
MLLLLPFAFMVWTRTTFSRKNAPLIVIYLWIIRTVAFWYMKYLVDLHISRMLAVHTVVFGRSSGVFGKVGAVYCSWICV